MTVVAIVGIGGIVEPSIAAVFVAQPSSFGAFVNYELVEKLLPSHQLGE